MNSSKLSKTAEIPQSQLSRIEIRNALKSEKDINILLSCDKHIKKQELINSIQLDRVYIAEENGRFAGWLRYNLFWDNTPFMNMLYLLDDFRGKGYGRVFLKYWEEKMKNSGYNLVMTSTQSDEYAQHFYLHLGYKAIGGFTPVNEPFEIILSKELR